MASVSDEAPSTQNNEVELSTSENQLPVENQEKEQIDTPQSSTTTTANEDDKEQVEQVEQPEEGQNKPSTSTSIEPEGVSQNNKPIPSVISDVQEENTISTPAEDINKENIHSKSQDEQSSTSKSRSVNFASTVDDTETSNPRSSNTRSSYSSSRASRRPVDFIDTLVESYKLETSNGTSPNKEEKKYVPKTNRSRLNPNWREHRTRRLMNKLEELSLWDREEELKAAQAQSLREQKWEQIQDRQRNHDLCLNLMRQRHESEMESAVILDRAAASVNDESTHATIARAMNIASPANILAYDLPTPPQTLRRHIKQEQENSSELKTPIGRYKQFETTMDNKLEKINQKLQPDREIMFAYSPYRTSIPPTAVPLFSETYSALLSVPDTYSTNKYNQYHYGVAPHLHQSIQHASSPDYETRLRSYSNRDVRVPLKEQENDYNYYDNENLDENNRSNFIDYDHYTKYRTNPVEHDYYTKYRSTSIEPEYQSKYRSNLLDNDLHPKRRLNLLDDEHYSKHRSNLTDDDFQSKYRSNPVINDDEDDYYTKNRSKLSSTLDYSPPRRTTSLASPTASALYDYSTVANTPREFSFIHSRQPASTSIHLRSLNDDLNAITRFSTDTSKKILQNISDLPNESSTKTRITSTKKNVSFPDDNLDNENYTYNNNSSRNLSSKTTYQPIEILSLSSTR